MPATPTFLIVEDDMLIAQDLKEILEDIGYQHILKCRNYNSAIELLNTEKIDLVLLDINLNDAKTGIDLGKIINQQFKMPFIYITSYSDADTMEGVKQTFPSGFLLKPYSAKLLQATIEIAFFNYANEQEASTKQLVEKEAENEFIINNSLLLKDNSLFIKIPLSDILWFESAKNYVEVKTPQRKYIMRASLKKLLASLPKQYFLRCHKQFIINVQHVKKFGTHSLFIQELEIPISRNEKEEVLKLLKTV